MWSGVEDAVGLTWTGRLLAEPKPGTIKEVDAAHWWKHCREIPGQYI